MKIAAFVVVNASGSVVDRQGNIVSCHPAPSWHGQPTIAELMTNVPISRVPNWEPSGLVDTPTRRNTTVSLIVTNEKLDYAGLRRLAIQVHTSMARAIQPFSTFDDGDTLFTTNTDEVPAAALGGLNLDTIAGETMWDAILASVPGDPAFAPPPAVNIPPEQLRSLAGTYALGPQARLQVNEDGGVLNVLALDAPVFEFHPGAPTAVLPISATEFYVDGRYHTRVSFIRDSNGKVTGATLNPGLWAQTGKRLSD